MSIPVAVPFLALEKRYPISADGIRYPIVPNTDSISEYVCVYANIKIVLPIIKIQLVIFLTLSFIFFVMVEAFNAKSSQPD